MNKKMLGALGIGLVVVLLASCSDDGDTGAVDGGNGDAAGGSGGGISTGGSSGTGTGGSSGIGTGGSSGTGGAAPTCASATDCASGQVCQPYSQSCVTPGTSCSSHGDCTGDQYCDSTSGSCLPSSVGSPCASDDNCTGVCSSNVCGCTGSTHEQELISGPLDIYFIFDRTSSMGTDCAYQPGSTPPVQSKACFATYAMADYLINVNPQSDTRLAFQFMSLPGNSCDGAAYSTPLIDLMQLPVAANDPLIAAISNENFAGGYGTEIEGALRGIAFYTGNNHTNGRQMIGVLMTDGDPNGCNGDISALSQILADHLVFTGIRTFIIGMEGATDANLEQLGQAGGADPHPDWCGSVSAPCHYWNVGNGSGNAIASALQAIISQASPLPCTYDVVGLTPPPGETLDYARVNVTLTDPGGVPSTIGQVPDAASCPTGVPAWYYDNPSAPTNINLCPSACDVVQTAQQGARVTVVVGCQGTVTVPK